MPAGWKGELGKELLMIKILVEKRKLILRYAFTEDKYFSFKTHEKNRNKIL